MKIFTVPAPRGALGVRVEFTPPDSRLRFAEVTCFSGGIPAPVLVRAPLKPGFAIDWFHPAPAPVELTVECTFEGVPPDRHQVRFMNGDDEAVGATVRRWKKICFLRDHTARGHPSQEYLAELDRTTNEMMLRAAGEFDEKRWLNIVGLQNALTHHAFLRFSTSNPATLIPDALQAPIRIADDAFHRAEDRLQHDQKRIGQTMLEFAAGRLQLPLDLGNGDVHVLAGQPDSANLFLFFEFALACIRAPVRPEFWTAMLPCYAAMIDIFIERFGPRQPHAISHYNVVKPPPLSIDRLQRLAPKYNGKASVAELEKRVQQMMRESISHFDNMPIR